MRCRKHYTDLTSIVGVCASCLRERLFCLLAAQAQCQTLEEKNCNWDRHPVFPRSVSPYISRRKSVNSAAPSNNLQNSDRKNHQSPLDGRFFSTPQVGPATGDYTPYRKKKQSFIRFSLFANLFRSKKRNGTDSDPRVSVSNSNDSCRSGGGSATLAIPSPLWFSKIRSGGGSRKKQPLYFDDSSTNSGAGAMRKVHCRDRGMSPVRYADGCGDGEDEFCDGSSAYESCESRRQTPWTTPAHPSVRRTGGGGHGRNVSGLTFCLSPLVRASPNRHWNQKGLPPADGGEIRAPVKPHLSDTKSFCANRSRKLADYGRFNTHR